MESEWNFATLIALGEFFLFAIAIARWEKFIFGDRDFHIGPPDLWVFVAGYHIPMFLTFVLYAFCADALVWNFTNRFLGVIFFLPSAAIVEDMFYYVDNPFDKPDTSESITDALGFIGSVPVVWIAGFIYTCLIVWWRLL